MTRAEYHSRPGRSSKWIRREKRFAIYLRDRFACLYCGADLRDAKPGQVGLDHLIPQCRGGSNEAANLVTACRTCNSGRQARPWRRYATPGAVQRIQRHIRRALNLDLAKAILAGTEPWPQG
jgi:5-methylcytosine-specific restriction endonuclease McrA